MIYRSVVSGNLALLPPHRYVRACLQSGRVTLLEGEENALIELIKSVSALSMTFPLLRLCVACLSILGVYGTRYVHV